MEWKLGKTDLHQVLQQFNAHHCPPTSYFRLKFDNIWCASEFLLIGFFLVCHVLPECFLPLESLL